MHLAVVGTMQTQGPHLPPSAATQLHVVRWYSSCSHSVSPGGQSGPAARRHKAATRQQNLNISLCPLAAQTSCCCIGDASLHCSPTHMPNSRAPRFPAQAGITSCREAMAQDAPRCRRLLAGLLQVRGGGQVGDAYRSSTLKRT